MLIEKSWPPQSQAWWNVCVFSLAAFLSYADRQIINLVVDPVRADLQISTVQISLVQGISFSLIYAIAGLPLGRMADMASRRSIIFWGVAIWSAATLASGLSTSFLELLGARFVIGIGEATLTPAAISIIADSFPSRTRGTAIGLFIMGMAVGSGTSLWAGGALYESAQRGTLSKLSILAEVSPWRVPFLLLGLIGISMCALLMTVREPIRRHSSTRNEGGDTRPMFEIIRQHKNIWPSTVPLIIATALMATYNFAITSWMPTFLARNFNLGPAAIGVHFGLILAFCGIVGSLLAGTTSDRLAKRFGEVARVRMLIGTSVLGLLGATCGLYTGLSTVLIVAFIAMMASSLGGTAAMVALQSIVPDELRGLATSVIVFGNLAFGLSAGSFLTAYSIDHIFQSPLAAGNAIALIAIPSTIGAIALYGLSSRALYRLHTSG